MQALGVAPAFHHAAGELVDDDDLAVLDDVVGVEGEKDVGAQGLVDVVHQTEMLEMSKSPPSVIEAPARSRNSSIFSTPASVKT